MRRRWASRSEWPFLADVFGSNEGRCALEPTSSHARAKRLCLIGLLVSQGKSDNNNTGIVEADSCKELIVIPFFCDQFMYTSSFFVLDEAWTVVISQTEP